MGRACRRLRAGLRTRPPLHVSATTSPTAPLHVRCTELRNVSFGASLTSVGTAAFKECAKLRFTQSPLSLPLVTEVGGSAFAGCTSLQTDVLFSDALTTMGDEAFSGAGVTRVHLGATIDALPYRAFFRCTSLLEVSGGEAVSSIGGYAFCASIADRARDHHHEPSLCLPAFAALN